MPGQVAVEPCPLGKLRQPFTDKAGAAFEVVGLEEDVRHRVRSLAVLAAQIQRSLDQLPRGLQLVHLMIGEGVPAEEPPVVAEGRRERVELFQHPLALLDATAVEVAAQPLQHDRRIARRLAQVLVDQRRRLGRLASGGGAEDGGMALLAGRRPLRELVRAIGQLGRTPTLAAEEVEESELRVRQREVRIELDRAPQRVLDAEPIGQHPVNPVAIGFRCVVGRGQRQPP